MAKEKNHFSPFKPVAGNSNTIQCKDCLYRDKTIVNGFPFGITKGNCEIFVEPDLKPIGIINGYEDCNFYEKEK